MCETCGCGKTEEHDHKHHHHHDHDKGHPHDNDHHNHSHKHDHKHDHHDHKHDHKETRTLSLEQKVLSKNEEWAEKNRSWLREHGVVAINLISSPGSGKTLLLEKTLLALKNKIPCAVLTGDLQTDNDARRLQGKGAEIRQIETGSACHLSAEQVHHFLPDVVKPGTRLLFIENVGNLVCPAAFDLGETFKIALLSTTEGEDKPVKYPTLFARVPVAIITKTDLIPHLDWDAAKCRDYLRRTHPGVFIFELSAKTGQGMDSWLDYITKLVDTAK